MIEDTGIASLEWMVPHVKAEVVRMGKAGSVGEEFGRNFAWGTSVCQ